MVEKISRSDLRQPFWNWNYFDIWFGRRLLFDWSCKLETYILTCYKLTYTNSCYLTYEQLLFQTILNGCFQWAEKLFAGRNYIRPLLLFFLNIFAAFELLTLTRNCSWIKFKFSCSSPFFCTSLSSFQSLDTWGSLFIFYRSYSDSYCFKQLSYFRIIINIR